MPQSGVHLPNLPRRHTSSPAARTAPQQSATTWPQPSPPTPPPNPSPTITHSRKGVSRPRYWLAGTSLLAGLLIMADVNPVKPSASDRFACQSDIQTKAALSRETLAQLLTIPERQPKAAVQQTVGTPYCSLLPVEVRAGVPAERAIYPLDFEPDAWVVLLYEGDEYAGYDFKFPNG